MNIDKMKWDKDGWPHIGIPSDTPQPVPKVKEKQEFKRHYVFKPFQK